jgi:hypothetical protein
MFCQSLFLLLHCHFISQCRPHIYLTFDIFGTFLHLLLHLALQVLTGCAARSSSETLVANRGSIFAMDFLC